MSHRIAAIVLAAASIASAQPVDPAKVFADAVSFWDMSSARDRASPSSDLTPTGGETRFAVPLEGSDRDASLNAGGDGLVATMNDAAFIIGQGASGEANLAGREVTMLIRMKNMGSWDHTPFSKHGGGDLLQYNMFAFELDGGRVDLGFQLGTERGVARAAEQISPVRARDWNTIIARYDGRSIDLAVNGRISVPVRHSGRLRPASGVPLVLAGEPQAEGGGYRVARRLTGEIDHAAIWDRALSDDEIIAVSGGIAPLETPHLRPQIHFAPKANWINDPNGMMYANGRYHLFYQHNPYGDTWGHMSWGHATSTDLTNWDEQPVALREQNGVMIFSGSGVSDTANSSGFGTDGNPPLVAIYTGHQSDPPRQDQRLAYSIDQGDTWTKYSGNPVIDKNLSHFRDPKVFWHEPTGRWVMLVSQARNRIVDIYVSDDLRVWEQVSSFGPAGQSDVPNWECPELFELPVDGDPNDTRWVLQIDVGNNGPAGGSGGMYFVGHFDGERFINENPRETTLWVDHGSDFYAAQAFNHDPKGRVVWLAWMNNWRYANAVPTGPWRGQMSIPREVGLTRLPDGVRLTQRPASEVVGQTQTTFAASDFEVPAGRHTFARLLEHNGYSRHLNAIPEGAYIVTMTARPEGAIRFGGVVKQRPAAFTPAGAAVPGPNQPGVQFGYDLRLREMFVDRRRSGETGFHPNFADVHYAPLIENPDGSVTLEIIVDNSSIELLGGARPEALTAAISDLIFPAEDWNGVSLFADLAPVTLESLTIRGFVD
ncbi:MAG: GH32 C-terminal domain-containing protein [Planctomycetota bacterium]